MEDIDIKAEKIGYDIFGPFIAAYCQWLHEQKQMQSLSGLAFLSRDGFLIKKIYEIMYPDEKVKNYYVRISRKALRLPYIAICPSYEEFIKILPSFRNYRIKDFINSICDINDIVLPEKFDLNYSVPTNKLSENTVFEEIYYYIRGCILKKSETQYAYLNQYFVQSGIYGKIGLVDHSYKASSQYLLEKVIDRTNISFWGLYFYTNDIANKRINGNMSSFMNSIINRRSGIVFEKGILTERLLFEACGTTLYYEIQNHKVIPVLAEYNQSADVKIISAVQNGAIKFAWKIYNHELEINVSRAINSMLALLKKPTQIQAEILGQLHDDDIKFKSICLAKVDNKDTLIKKIRNVNEAVWRQGYLIQIPAGTIFCNLYNLIFDAFHSCR